MVGDAADAEAAAIIYRRTKPDVTLMDLRLGNTSGVEVISAIRSEFPDGRFIVLTTFDEDEEIKRALKAGAFGYLLKDVTCDELIEAIQSVAQGRKRLSPGVAARAWEGAPQADLTPRELDVLRGMVAGKSNRAIADDLGISEATIKWHVNNLMAKMDVTARTQAVLAALRRGLVKLG